ncbi:putative spliceosomal protein sap [Tribonema minus]|uniref:Putative spliceosomal protein sap n=1 Tax=Tribonema minus TaxID=303371 RepID=A0A835YUV4_9STRA|nr:putative spliceosomal protein sap [Tribonema minus]
MHLLHLNLHRAGAINATAYGCFTGNKAQEIIVARNNAIELLRVEGTDMPKLVSIAYQPAFCVVRSLVAFKMVQMTKDYLAIGSDSGKITVLEWSAETGEMKAVHTETFGKTGCRRIVPGQYMCADPQGRALMIAAVEKQKLVYVLNRDQLSRLTISSPLEAHKTQAICFCVCALDVHFENPIFAAIEIDYGDADQDPSGEEAESAEKNLVYYQHDLGLNHVTRMWTTPISRTASFLLQVPGGALGPSGVLVCGENWVAYRHQEHPEVRTPVPRRKDVPPERGVLVTAGAVHKSKDMFFFLLQSEYGDVYKVTLDLDPTNKEVLDVVVSVFDTIPIATSLRITRRGLLFCASESSNHLLFSISSLATEGAVTGRRCDDGEIGDDSDSAAKVAATFVPSATLNNLVPTDEMESLAPIISMLVGDLANESTPQMYCLCGQGPRSTLRILRHGLAVTEVAVSDLPGRPAAVWSVPKHIPVSAAAYFIVVTFTNATLVLSVGDTVEEVSNSGFLLTAPTLEVQLLANGSTLQVHANGLRVIAGDRAPQEWRTPGRKTIEKACANSRQAVIALAGGELIYFRLDDTSNMLQEMGTKELGHEVACLEMGEVPLSRLGAPFLAVGDWTGAVRVLSLAPESLLTQQAIMDVPHSPHSLCLMEMAGVEAGASTAASSATSSAAPMGAPQLYLYVGLENGVMQRVAVDATTGTLSDARSRFLGTKPVKLFRMGQGALLALSSRSWLSYSHGGRHLTTPMSYETLQYAGTFCTEHCPEGIVAISDTFLRILSVERKGEAFNQQAIPLRYTPRQIARLDGQGDQQPRLVIVEADADEYNEAEKAEMKAAAEAESAKVKSEEDGVAPMDTDQAVENGDKPPPPPPDADGNEDEDEEEEEAMQMPIRGPVPPGPGKWASCVRLLDPAQGTTLECLELGNNEAALSVCPVTFHSRGGEVFIAAGTAKDLQFHPRSHGGCFVHIFRVLENRLVLLHSTEVPDVPLAMSEFQGRLLVGAGKSLRLYDLGKRKLLRKCEHKGLPNMVVSLNVMNDRVVAGDMAESLHFVKYRRLENQLVVFADDQVPRHIARSCLLDYDTAAGCDKFGNFFVLRLPDDVSDDIDNPSGNRVLWDHGMLNGAPNKLTQMTMFHLGDILTSLHKTTLVPGGAEVVLYSSITGALGAFLPFSTKEDVDFFVHLEMHMRQEKPTLCGREHTSYRSYFLPVKNVVDGDLCEQFGTLPLDIQKKIATGLDRTVGEVAKKLEDVRNRLL